MLRIINIIIFRRHGREKNILQKIPHITLESLVGARARGSGSICAKVNGNYSRRTQVGIDIRKYICVRKKN